MVFSISPETWCLALFTVLVLTNCSSSGVILQIQGLDIATTFEQTCIKPHPVVARNVKYEWMLTIPQWYIPLQSKLNFVRYAETLLQTPADNFTQNGLTQDKIDSGEACLGFRWDKPPILSGLGGKSVGYTVTNVMENSYGFNTRWTGDTRGRHYFTLRDNETFVFFTTCWGDGYASWSVISTLPTLGEETIRQIYEHAKSLGFSEDNFFQQSYESCPKFGDGTNLEKNEL